MTGGLAFPFRITDAGTARTAGGPAELARAQLQQLLFTAPGERVDRPDFGCGLHLLVFSAADVERTSLTEYLVRAAITRHLGRLILLDAVRVTVDDATLVVDVLYTLRTTGEELAGTFTRPLIGPAPEATR
ncbi:GPW/gp25 family protein [Micromonospora sp. NPDC005806]|uniref:GPW/gp25 family protein n=1 Tax=Micromonospora sp. NPDC005806 TaxID=3364234 RepID=UPI00367B8A40